MQTSYELIKATKQVIGRNKEAFQDFISLSVSDMFFQSKFIICDDVKTNEELVELYKYIKKNLFLIENVNEVAGWVNELIVERTNKWLKMNRQDMFDAEKRGLYEIPQTDNSYTTGLVLEPSEYTRVLAGFVCNLPEIHRITTLAFYYNDFEMDKISDLLGIDYDLIKSRINFVEGTLNVQMKEYCKKNGYEAVIVDSQRIRTALIEIGKLYQYPYAKQIYDIVTA